MWSDIILIALVLPVVAYFTVKLGTYAFFRAKYLADKRNQNEGESDANS